jgi:hypothetical protein
MTNGLSNVTAIASPSGVQTLIDNTQEVIYTEVPNFVFSLAIAIIIFILGWVVAELARRIFGRILKIVKFEQFLKEQKVSQALGTVVISTVLTKILYYYIIVIFLQEAFLYLNLGTVAAFIALLLTYLPRIITAVLLVVAAALIGEFIKNRIIDIGRKSTTVHFLGRAAKAIIVFLGIMSALETAQLGVTLIEQAFIVIVGALSFGLALAFGIAFGLGAQNDAKDWTKAFRKKFNV